MSDNPHKNDTPEWQLWERVKSEELKAISYAKDAEKSTQMAARARECAETYRTALERLANREQPQ